MQRFNHIWLKVNVGGSRTNVGGKIVCKLPSNFVCAQKITLSAVGLYKEVKEAIMGWLNVWQECDVGIQEQQITTFPLELTIQSFLSNERPCAVVVTGETLFKTAPACVALPRQGSRCFSQLPPQRELHNLHFIPV